MQTKYDIIIAGGGMAGASLACALANEETSIALIEAIPLKLDNQPSYDDRGLSLSLSSQRILKALNIWPQIAMNASPIRHIHISDRGHFGFVRLHAESVNLDALGHVVIAREFGQALISQIENVNNVEFISPSEVVEVKHEPDHVRLTLTYGNERKKLLGRLLVVADGVHSKIRDQLGINSQIKDYGQTAIVTNVSPERPHEDTAYERFTESGPLALLPHTQQRCVVVYAVPTEKTDNYLGLSETEFLSQLQRRFGRRLGRFTKAGARKAYPLLLVKPQEQICDRIVLLGNSAHTIHPNAAQGFNLCLRDIAALAEQLIHAIRIGQDPGNRQLLDAYVAARRSDQQRVIRFTDQLADLFSNQHLAKIIVRDAGMLITDLIPAFKQRLMLQGMGIWGRQPAMVSGG